MTHIRSYKHTQNVEDRIKNQKLKLKLLDYINWLIFIFILYGIFLIFWENISGEKLNNIYIYSIIILPIVLILRINISSFIRTDVTSIELIGFYFFEIASKLDKDIRDTNKKIIKNRLKKIQSELNLINSFYNDYPPENVRKSEPPLSGNNQKFIFNLEKILRKLSYAIINNVNLPHQLELDLNLLAEELCKNPPEITEHMEGLLVDIFNDLNHVTEDEHFAESFIKKITSIISVKIKSNYYIRLLISIIILFLVYLFFPQSHTEIKYLIIGGIICAIVNKFLNSQFINY